MPRSGRRSRHVVLFLQLASLFMMRSASAFKRQIITRALRVVSPQPPRAFSVALRPRNPRFQGSLLAPVGAGAVAAAACALFATNSASTDCDAAAAPKGKLRTVRGSDPGTRDYWPPIQPYKTGRLKVSDTHELYYEESGNPNGKPVVFLHGGPGGGTNGDMRRYFNPQVYRIVLFDQRGCGQSTPHACLDDNTTWHLVSDIEKLREALGVDKWMVFGGSWGSTLALTYAEEHPSRVTELVLRGIFMLRRKELQFYYQEGSSWIYPDWFESYRNHIPEDERHDLIEAYRKRLTSEEESVRLAAAKEWTRWEMATSKLFPDTLNIDKAEDAKFALAFARIENHFFHNRGWFPVDDYVLKNVHKIQHIPVVIVQGRYDVVCPMQSAFDLHQAWPSSELVVVQDAGHSAAEVGIKSELIKACERFAAAHKK